MVQNPRQAIHRTDTDLMDRYLTSHVPVQALPGEPVEEGAAKRVCVGLHVGDVGHSDDVVGPGPQGDVVVVSDAIRSLQKWKCQKLFSSHQRLVFGLIF